MLFANHFVRWLTVALISLFLQTAKGHDDLKQQSGALQFRCEDFACFQKYWHSLSAELNAGVVEAFKSRGVSLVEITDAALSLIPTAFREQAEEEQDEEEQDEEEKAKFYQTAWDDLPQTIKDWIKAHPYQTAFHVVNGIVFFVPSAASGPVLWILGYTSAGPRAASFASLLQSKIGMVGARSFFAYLQSAPMGGYGAPAVNMGTRVFAFLGANVPTMWDWIGSDSQESKDEKTSSESKA
ncbi:integral component of membrane protein [Rutstroemia sp. NJR-2017a WRK4]|nr:integral component of membrane protein [Rutstroemia sp. NJR-2017a WRK4]